uniref:Molybdenum cofactor biosynthesis protein MoaE n=1 Tax=Thermofilum pendens TaxID=2269 RepID=A0A7C4B8H5_THEPE
MTVSTNPRNLPDANCGFRDEIRPGELLEEALSALGDDVGAVAVFVGRVKGVVEGKRVDSLEYEVLEPQASLTLQRICEEEAEKHGLAGVRVYHKRGLARVGEPVLFIAAASKGRREALEALREILERVKHEAFVWKLERREDGEYWVLGDSKRVPRGQASSASRQP